MPITINDMDICTSCGTVVSTPFINEKRCPVCKQLIDPNVKEPISGKFSKRSPVLTHMPHDTPEGK